MPTLSTEQSGARKIRARIQTCLESRAGSGTHGTLGRPPSRSRQAPRATATEVTASTATSAETTSRDDESSNVMVDPERWDAGQAAKAEVRHRSPTRSTSAGLSQRAFTGSSAATSEPWQQVRTSPPPLAFAPPKKAVQTLGASAPPAATAEAAASAAAATTTAGGDSQELLQVYRNIFEEVILRDHEYGATLRKVKGVYESYFLEVQRENARLRDFVATLQRALQGRGAAQAPLRWTAPSPDRDLAAAWAPTEKIQVATASPQRPFARPASVPRSAWQPEHRSTAVRGCQDGVRSICEALEVDLPLGDGEELNGFCGSEGAAHNLILDQG